MPLCIHNPATGRKEPLLPLENNVFRLIAWTGSAVYGDDFELARGAVIFDVVMRYLEYRGYTLHCLASLEGSDIGRTPKDRPEDPGGAVLRRLGIDPGVWCRPASETTVFFALQSAAGVTVLKSTPPDDGHGPGPLPQPEEAGSGEPLRFYILAAHYRCPLPVPDTAMLEETGRALKRLREARYLVRDWAGSDLDDQALLAVNVNAEAEELQSICLDIGGRLIEAMDDDFNCPDVLAALFDLSRKVLQIKNSLETSGAPCVTPALTLVCAEVEAIFDTWAVILGLDALAEEA